MHFAPRTLLALLLTAVTTLAWAQDATPKPGGTLIVAMFDAVEHLNPAITTNGPVHAVADSVFNGLTYLDEDGEPQPDLATAWRVSEDGRTYTFDLRQNVTWHDGEPFTADDVAFTFEQVLLRYHTRTRGGLASILDTIETPDDHTVVFRFREPYGALLQRLHVTEAPILPEHVYGTGDVLTHEANLAPIGTGPFRFERFVRDDRIELVRNEAYFRDGLPYLDRVILRIIPNATTRMLALAQGEVDHVLGFPASEVARSEGDPNLNVATVPHSAGGSYCLFKVSFNLERAPLDDVAVRHAIAHAVNRDAFLERVAFGQGKVATGPISSDLSNLYTADVARYDYDPTLAARLLDEAGYTANAEGERLRFDMLHFPMFSRHAEQLRADLAAVGITLDLVSLDRAAYVSRVYGERDFDLGFISSCNETDPSIGVSQAYVSSNIGAIPFSNAPAYRNAEVDALFAQAAGTVDPEARRELYAEVQRVLVNDLPYLWLVERRYHQAHAPEVKGLAPWSTAPFERAWLDR